VRYVSTRGGVPKVGFDEVLLTGLAGDGGLYVPEKWPEIDLRKLGRSGEASYAEVAANVMMPFVKGSVIEPELFEITNAAYAGFSDPAVAPLVELAPNEWLLELFHGPTLSFKDYALQVVGPMLERVLNARSASATIVGATSGDTGSAAIEACKGREAMSIFVLHPKNRISDVQRRQMTTVTADNVFNIAIDGTFDDCQTLVKALFSNKSAREELQLSAINSINWARIIAQAVYYVSTSLVLGGPEKRAVYSVPTGNFGNVYAGYTAHCMGVPVECFVVGSNSNDILTRYFESGAMTAADVVPTLSPAMDIQISSNFERLLFEAYDRNSIAVAGLMASFKKDGQYTVAGEARSFIDSLFCGYRIDDKGALAVMRRIYEGTGKLIDPHTAVGIACGRQFSVQPTVPRVTIATAHPAKFTDAVQLATGVKPELPNTLSDLFERPENYVCLPNDIDVITDYIYSERPSP